MIQDDNLIGKIISGHSKFVFMNVLNFSEPSGKPFSLKNYHNAVSSSDILLTDFLQNLRLRIQFEPQNRDFPVLLPSLKNRNFAHTCRRVKSPGVSENCDPNSFISEGFEPIWSR